jgi:hypothetical protein
MAQLIRGYLKSKVYSTRPKKLHALNENIGKEITKLSEKQSKPLCGAS